MKSATQNSKYFDQGIDFESQILENISGFIYNVNIVCFSQKIEFQGKEINIHYIQCGNFEQPTIVLLHGYGGSSIGFYKIMKRLSQNFKVYAFDWPGMGLSDRLDFGFKQNNPMQVIDFFVGILENWRKECGINQFTVVAHSFGGYIASHYYYRYPNNITQLFLLSPMGGTKKKQQEQVQNNNQQQQNENKSQENEEDEEEGGFFNWIANYLVKNAKLNRYTPQSVLDKWFIPKNYVLKKAVNSSLKKENDKVKEIFVSYFQSIFNIPSCDDSYIHDLIDYPSLDPEISLEELFNQQEYLNRPDFLKKNIHVIFGDSDFMCSQGCENLISNQIWKGNLVYLNNTSHGIMIDAPQQVLSIIFNPERAHMYQYSDPLVFLDDEEYEESGEQLIEEQNYQGQEIIVPF